MRKNGWMVMLVSGVLTLPAAIAVADPATTPARTAEQRAERKADQLENQGDRKRQQADTTADRLEDQGKDRQAKRTRDQAEMRADQLEDRADRTRQRADQRNDRLGTNRGEATGEKLGDGVTDAWITTKVKASFVGEDALKRSDISVDTDRDGVVTLTGYVPTAAARERALEIVRNTKGVREVKDQLNVGTRSKR